MKDIDNSASIFSKLPPIQSCHICEQGIKSTLHYYNHLVKHHNKLELSLYILELLKLLIAQNEMITNTSLSTEQSTTNYSNDFTSANENGINSDSVNKPKSSNSNEINIVDTILCPNISTSLFNAEKNENVLSEHDTESKDAVKVPDSSFIDETTERIIQCYESEEEYCSNVELDPVLSPSQLISVPDNVSNDSQKPLENCLILNEIDNQNIPQRKISASDNVDNPSYSPLKNLSNSHKLENFDKSQKKVFQASESSNVDNLTESPLKNLHVSNEIKNPGAPQKGVKIFQRKESNESDKSELSNKFISSDDSKEDEVFEGTILGILDNRCKKPMEEGAGYSKNCSEMSKSNDCDKLDEDQTIFFGKLGLTKYDSPNSDDSINKIPTIANVLTEIESTKCLYSSKESFNFRIPIKFFTENLSPEDNSIFEPLLSPLLETPCPNSFSERTNADLATEITFPPQSPAGLDVSESGGPSINNPVENMILITKSMRITDSLESHGDSVSDIQSRSSVLPGSTANASINRMSTTNVTSVESETDPQSSCIMVSNGKTFDTNTFINLVSQLVSCKSSEQNQSGAIYDCNKNSKDEKNLENSTFVQCEQGKCNDISKPVCDNSLARKPVISTSTNSKIFPTTEVPRLRFVEGGNSSNCRENFSDKIVRLLNEKQALDSSTANIRGQSAVKSKNGVDTKIVSSVDSQTEKAVSKTTTCSIGESKHQIAAFHTEVNTAVLSSIMKTTDRSVEQIIIQNKSIINNFEEDVARTSASLGNEAPKQESINASKLSDCSDTPLNGAELSVRINNDEISQSSENCGTSEVSCSEEVLKVSSSTCNSSPPSFELQEMGVKSNELDSNISSANNSRAKVSSSSINCEPSSGSSMTCLPFLIGTNGMFWQVFETENNPNPVQILKPVQFCPFGSMTESAHEDLGKLKRKRSEEYLLESDQAKKRCTSPKVNKVDLELINTDKNVGSASPEIKDITSEAEQLNLLSDLLLSKSLTNPSTSREARNHQNCNQHRCLHRILCEPDVNYANADSVDTISLSKSISTNDIVEGVVHSTYLAPMKNSKRGDIGSLPKDLFVVPERRFNCQFCDKKYTNKTHLLRHVRTHMNYRPFKCDQCDKSFSTTTILKQHARCHSGERPFVCSVCDKAFAHKSSLLTHSMLHNGKRFKCFFCRQAFVSNHKLRRHLRRHDHKDSGLYCCKCEFQFTVEGTFLEHLLSIHSFEPCKEVSSCKKRKVQKCAPHQIPIDNSNPIRTS